MTYRAAAKPAPRPRARATRPSDRPKFMPRHSSESVGVSKDSSNESGYQPRGNLLWGGRFSAKPDALMQAINVSIGFDKRLEIEDLAGSKAHVAMLRSEEHTSE